MAIEIVSSESVTCSICRDDIDLTTMYALHCNHKFHMECIHSWLVIHPSCPLCRASVPYNVRRDVDNLSFETQEDFIINISDYDDSSNYDSNNDSSDDNSDTETYYNESNDNSEDDMNGIDSLIEEMEQYTEDDAHDYIGITDDNFNMFNWLQLSRNYRLSEFSMQIFINNIESYTSNGITAILNNFSQFQILSEQFIRANISYLDARLLVANQFQLRDEFVCYLETLYQ